MGIKGVTLIELMAAVVLVSVVVSSMALYFPYASRAAIVGHYQTIAKNLALGKIQEIKQIPYPLIPVTSNLALAPYTYNFTSVTCNCNLEPNPDIFPVVDPPSDVVTDRGITFTRRTCISLASRDNTTGAFVGTCPQADGSTDTGLKNIRVRVSWTPTGGPQKSIDAESMVSR